MEDGSDCDDGDDAANPDASEICDGSDNDCDGATDEDDAEDAATWYADADADGYGDASSSATACSQPSGHVDNANDCDDGDAAINPGASEVCDGVDNDCDGSADADATDATTWYADADGDGYGDASSSSSACDQPTGYVADDTDCDDDEANANPAGSEVCDGVDNDCDGSVDQDASDASLWYADSDDDGYGDASSSMPACDQPSGYVADDSDCDDGEVAANPGAAEICDGIDNDCDSSTDEDDAEDAATWYADADNDGYGDATSSTVACDQPSGHVSDDTDCDDAEAAANPGAAEVCDGIDNDCDGSADNDATDAATWFADADNDGYGDASSSTVACDQPSGYISDDSDCDDADASVNPAASEVCDGIDNDCEGTADQGASDASTWYADSDGDGYGDAGSSSDACDQPTGYVADDTDCDDGEAAANPGASEICDGIDNDCDSTADEDDAEDAATWYADADNDGYGDASSSTLACSQPSGHVSDDTDCDDGEAAANPGAAEVCDGIDNDCDGSADNDATDASTWYADADSDGYGDASASSVACDQPSGYISDDSDCDDGDAATHPGATEVCDGSDNDCDSSIDEDASDASTWYADSDSDGYGDASTSSASCDQPSGYVEDDSDCDDTDADVNPDALEICDSADNDCDGSTDESDAWWDESWTYRIPVTLTASSYDVDGPPVTVEADFRSALDDLGDSDAFDEESMRVVLQDCSLGQPELPSQFLDDWTDPFAKDDAVDSSGDEAGTVVFLYDEDGDYSSLETLAASSEVELAIYFDTSGSDPAYATDLVAEANELKNDVTTAEFDEDAGGLLDELKFEGSVNLMSQTESCCGNSIYTTSWAINPQDNAGTLTLLEEGPVFAATEASGSLSDSYGGFEYSYTYFMFAGRPELWSRIYQVTTADTYSAHSTDFTKGMRPWQSRHDDLATKLEETDNDDLYIDASDGTTGIAMAYHQAPTYVTDIYNADPHFILYGNDYMDTGTGTPATVPSGTVYMDNIVVFALPHDGEFADAEDTIFGLMEGVTTSVDAAESF